MRKSIGFRLLVGMLLVLGSVTVALGVTLLEFQEVRVASAEAKKRQWIREQALQIGTLAQKMFFLQNDFIVQERMNRGAYQAFLDTYAETGRILDALRREPVDRVERKYLEYIAENARAMRDIFVSDVVTARLMMDERGPRLGGRERAQLEALQQKSRLLLVRINELNDRLGRSFTGKLELAEAQAAQAWETSWSMVKILFPIAAVLCGLIILYSHYAIVHPISELTRAASVIADGDLTQRVPVRGYSEFERLAESFNRMTERLREHQRRLIHIEKMAGIGRLAAGIAHEINNPIAVILGYAKIMLKGKGVDDADYDALKSIEEEAANCRRIVEGLLDLSRPASGDGEVVDLTDVTDEVLSMADVLDRRRGVRVTRAVSCGPVRMLAGRARLKQVAVNMIMNALDAVAGRPDPMVRVSARVEPPSDGHDAVLVWEFEDNGSGIDEKLRDRLFEPFFTTKSAGTGLGLAVTYSIVRTFDGTIGVRTEKGKGTTFTIRMPVMAVESADEGGTRRRSGAG